MTQTKIIGLTGSAGSGKDAVRDILEDFGFIGLAFADPIRNMIRGLLTDYELSDGWMDERRLKERIIPALGVSYRQMAQTLGTEWGRSLRPDFWLLLAELCMDVLAANCDGAQFVISDVRFANEAQWVREHGGIVWRINRPGIEPVREHVSELEIDSIEPEAVIYNTGTLATLRDTVAALLEPGLGHDQN